MPAWWGDLFWLAAGCVAVAAAGLALKSFLRPMKGR
jgi:hypothetical protein